MQRISEILIDSLSILKTVSFFFAKLSHLTSHHTNGFNDFNWNGNEMHFRCIPFQFPPPHSYV